MIGKNMAENRCRYCNRILKDEVRIDKQCGKSCEEKHEKHQLKVSQFFNDK